MHMMVMYNNYQFSLCCQYAGYYDRFYSFTVNIASTLDVFPNCYLVGYSVSRHLLVACYSRHLAVGRQPLMCQHIIIFTL